MRNKLTFVLFPLLSFLIWYQPAVAQYEQPIFREVSQEANITDNRIGSDKVIGQAWGDIDNDGWLDLYVTDHAGPNTLYHNQGDGSFAQSPLNDQVALPEAYSGGAIFIDYDNDGWQDLYVLNWGDNNLYRNIEGTRFEDVTASAGVLGPGNSKTASWGDYNQDGFLDLYVANWACYPRCGRPSSGDLDKLYQNNGDGTFTDVTNLLQRKLSGSGFVASFTDFDNDGDLDIYLVNDEFINPIGNSLWRNDGAGCDGWCFTEISAESNADTTLMGMGLATTDYDNDGDQDFYFSNAGPMVLLQNQGDGQFRDLAPDAGVDSPGTIGWGAVFFDYDNDGWQDLYLALSDSPSNGQGPINPLYQNNRDGSFTDQTLRSGVADAGVSLGASRADYDRDGRVDLLVGNVDTGYKLYRNESETAAANHWVAIDLVGGGPINQNAIGSRVVLTLESGETRMLEVISGASLGSGNALTLHFGLESADVIPLLEVFWPDGTAQAFENVVPNRYLTLPYPADETLLAQQQNALYAGFQSNSSTASEFSPGLQILTFLGVVIVAGLFFGGLRRPN